jgi:hypothetical protein
MALVAAFRCADAETMGVIADMREDVAVVAALWNCVRLGSHLAVVVLARLRLPVELLNMSIDVFAVISDAESALSVANFVTVYAEAYGEVGRSWDLLTRALDFVSIDGGNAVLSIIRTDPKAATVAVDTDYVEVLRTESAAYVELVFRVVRGVYAMGQLEKVRQLLNAGALDLGVLGRLAMREGEIGGLAVLAMREVLKAVPHVVRTTFGRGFLEQIVYLARQGARYAFKRAVIAFVVVWVRGAGVDDIELLLRIGAERLLVEALDWLCGEDTEGLLDGITAFADLVGTIPNDGAALGALIAAGLWEQTENLPKGGRVSGLVERLRELVPRAQ